MKSQAGEALLLQVSPEHFIRHTFPCLPPAQTSNLSHLLYLNSFPQDHHLHDTTRDWDWPTSLEMVVIVSLWMGYSQRSRPKVGGVQVKLEM